MPVGGGWRETDSSSDKFEDGTSKIPKKCPLFCGLSPDLVSCVIKFCRMADAHREDKVSFLNYRCFVNSYAGVIPRTPAGVSPQKGRQEYREGSRDGEETKSEDATL